MMCNNKPTELTAVTIDGNEYDNVSVYGLSYTFDITDHTDDYGFGESAQVITNIDFDLVVIHLYGDTVDIDTHNKDWESVKKQVSEHILEDEEIMKEWQDRELAND
jgi:hypothetical protein